MYKMFLTLYLYLKLFYFKNVKVMEGMPAINIKIKARAIDMLESGLSHRKFVSHHNITIVAEITTHGYISTLKQTSNAPIFNLTLYG